MEIRKVIISIHVLTCLMICITQNVIAGPDWQEEQKQMFGQITVKPGDVIDQSNWDKLKGIVHEPILNWVKDSGWNIKVDEFKYDFDYTKEWYELSAKNKGRYGLGTNKEVVDLETGKYPMYISGLPFPDVDIQNDPDGPMKLMHNNNVCLMMNGSYSNSGSPDKGALQWIGPNGYERGVGFTHE